jgi:E3 ubiquitin-protein ligase UHRF1
MNLALAVSCAAKVNDKDGAEAKDWRKGKPIRVVRTEKAIKASKFAPAVGCRYDGIYKIVKYWPEKGREGFRVWRYLFRRDDATPGPWIKKGKKIIEANGYTCIYPDNYKEAQATKKRKVDRSVAVIATGDLDEEEEDGSRKEKRTYVQPEEVVNAIKSDTLNAKIWQDILLKPTATKLEFTDLVESFFQCPICQCLIGHPVTTSCGHNLCLECLQRLLRCSQEEDESAKCPHCRSDLGDVENKVNAKLKAALRMIFPAYEQDTS